MNQSHLIGLKEKLKKSNKDLMRYQLAIDKSSIFATADSKGVITYVNDKFSDISEYSKEELIGSQHKIINSGFHDKLFFADLWKTISSGKIWRGEIKNKKKSGDFYWVDTTIVPFMDQNNKPIEFISVRNDITQKENF